MNSADQTALVLI